MATKKSSAKKKADTNTRYIAKRTVVGDVPLYDGLPMSDEKLRELAKKKGVPLMMALASPDQVVRVRFTKHDILTAQDYPVAVLQHLMDNGRIEPYTQPLKADVGEVYSDQRNMLADDSTEQSGGDEGGVDIVVGLEGVTDIEDVAEPDDGSNSFG